MQLHGFVDWDQATHYWLGRASQYERVDTCRWPGGMRGPPLSHNSDSGALCSITLFWPCPDTGRQGSGCFSCFLLSLGGKSAEELQSREKIPVLSVLIIDNKRQGQFALGNTDSVAFRQVTPY